VTGVDRSPRSAAVAQRLDAARHFDSDEGAPDPTALPRRSGDPLRLGEPGVSRARSRARRPDSRGRSPRRPIAA
jgi:hypothetical protein